MNGQKADHAVGSKVQDNSKVGSPAKVLPEKLVSARILGTSSKVCVYALQFSVNCRIADSDNAGYF